MKQKLNVWVPSSLIEDIDEAAEERGVSRTDFVTMALKEQLTYLEVGEMEIGVGSVDVTLVSQSDK